MQARPGFSLIELIIVVTLVAVLVALALPKYTSMAYESKVAACRENYSSINLAIQAYKADNPDTTDKWAELGGTISTTHPLVVQHYLDTVPVCKVNQVGYTLTRTYGPFGNVVGWQVRLGDHFTGDWKSASHLCCEAD